jgi:hypothetical protein
VNDKELFDNNLQFKEEGEQEKNPLENLNKRDQQEFENYEAEDEMSEEEGELSEDFKENEDNLDSEIDMESNDTHKSTFHDLLKNLNF